LAHGRPANQLIDIRIGQVTAAGLREANPLAVIGA